MADQPIALRGFVNGLALLPLTRWFRRKNGCDPKEAAKELRIYAAAIRARTP